MTCSKHTLLATALLLAPLVTLGCDIDSGGANAGQQEPGNMDNGVALQEGQIAVSPTGTSFLARVGDQLIHGDVDGSSHELEALGEPERLLFAPQRDVVYVALDDPPRLRAHDINDDQTLWTAKLHDDVSHYDFSSRPWLQVTDDDRFVLVIDFFRIDVYDTKDGKRLGHWNTKDEIVDADISPDGEHLYVAYDEHWEGDSVFTPFSTYDLPALTSDTIWLPNCADEVVVGPRGHFAFMAPTRCQQDPVSVIDLDKGEFVRNLPGFGPVALASQGELAVAFMDLDNLDEALFLDGDPEPEGDSRYHLMLIDTRTLEFETVELGDSLPRYAPTPDGELLLIDANAYYDDERVRILDLSTGDLKPVLGPDVRLENFVLTQDSTQAFLVDEGAYQLSLTDRVLQSLPLAIIPTNVNITSDDAWLLFQSHNGPVHVYDIEARRVTTIVGDAPSR